MPQITETSFSDPESIISILERGLHGGFLAESSLSEEERRFCNSEEWVEKVYKFKCSGCGKFHTARPGEERCLRTQEPVEPDESKTGFRVIADSRLNIEEDTGYSLFVEETASSVNTTKLPYKSIVFLPDQEEMQFSDRAGSIVFLPLEALPSFTDEEQRTRFVQQINEKRKRLVDWERLDPGGDDFEELIFRLVERDNDYFNESWGGSGPDQGKDGFCSIDLGGRGTRILIQAKFNNQGDPVNGRQVEKSCRKAERHDCSGVIIGTVKSSGDLESEFEQGTFRDKSVNYLRVWSGPEVKEKLATHPDLIAEYFLE
jgi:hypothetical protein